MVDVNVQLSEKLGIVGTIDPAVVTASYSDYVDMAKYEQVLGIMLTGDMSAHAIDFAAYGYTNTAAGNETEIKAITQLAADAALNDNLQAAIVVRNEDVRAKSKSSGHELRYVRFKIASGSQSGHSAAIVLAGNARYGMESADNLASVVEVEDDLS